LTKALHTNSTLVHLALNDNNVSIGAPLADLLMENSTLTALELRNASLGPEDIRAVVDALYNNATIKKVQLLFNYFDLEAEVACQQLQLDRPDIELIWKEPGASTNWRQDEIEYIIDKFTPGKVVFLRIYSNSSPIRSSLSRLLCSSQILSVLLNNGNLEPLIDNNLLLPNLVLNESQALMFLDEMLQSSSVSRLPPHFSFLRSLDSLTAFFRNLWRGWISYSSSSIARENENVESP
jgi:hypothetical protein